MLSAITRAWAVALACRSASIVVLASWLICGCVPWPQPSAGGMAERHETDSVDILRLEGRYHALLATEAANFAVSRLIDVRNMLVRARREYAGGLRDDFGLTIGIAESQIYSIERELEFAASKRPRHRKDR